MSEHGPIRYRFRAYPTPGQAHMLAKTFGRLRDSVVQQRVVTLAKTTPERTWLGEVSSVALVQACQDARRAYRNWFDSMSGQRGGGRVGHPRLRSRKDNRQSIRLTRNGFAVTTRGVRIAKVGDVKLRWSRPLPSVPSSVTVIKEADGRYYASFVVAVAETPLPHAANDVGLDLGLDRLVVTSDGEVIANPRHLRRKSRALARSQRALSRKQPGSGSRRKAAHRVAVLHRRVRETRLDELHKIANRLVRENQAIYVEDLAIAGLARTRLAKSVYDAGWATLIRLIKEKAARCHRQVVKVSRWFPSSQLCSACGHLDGPKPLSVRSWTCGQCGVEHDRDVNAARNVLAEGRRVAAGHGGDVKRLSSRRQTGQGPAVGNEAGTRRGAA